MILLCSLCDFFTLWLWINSLIIWGNRFLRWSRRLKRGRSSIAEEFLPLKSICSPTKVCFEPLFQAAMLLECKLDYSFQLSCLVAHKILINLICVLKEKRNLLVYHQWISQSLILVLFSDYDIPILLCVDYVIQWYIFSMDTVPSCSLDGLYGCTYIWT